jgi:hypothetical protein
MNRSDFLNNEELLPFAERIDDSYYGAISLACEEAKKRAQKLLELEVPQTTSSYLARCIQLIEEVKQYVDIKRAHFIPYIKSLFGKSSAGHDCSSCNDGGACIINHQLQLTELKQAHIQLKDMISRFQMVALPLYSETIYPDLYRVLRSKMALLENSLGELFLLEEAYLIPKVTEAQKSINVRS